MILARLCAVPLALAIAVLGACKRDTPLPAAPTRAIALPTVPIARLVPIPPRVRVVITDHGIDVDNQALMASWAEEPRARLLQMLPADEAATLPFEHRDLVRIDGGHIAMPDALGPRDLEIRAVGDVLAYAHEIEKQYRAAAGDESSSAPKLNLYADGATPYALIAAVLYTAGQAEFDPVPIVQSPKGEVALTLAVPRSGSSATGPTLTLVPTGIEVRLEGPALRSPQFVMGSMGLLGLLEPSARPKVRAPAPDLTALAQRAPKSLQHRMVLGADRACPSVPRREGRYDIEHLEALLRDIARGLGGAGTIGPGADRETPWRDVASAAAAAENAGFDEVQFRRPHAEEDRGPSDCADGITAAELGPDDIQPTR